MIYRKEIDGLRAVAVLPVLFYHAGSEWFSGGYIGVDVFFVISGYLITSIIIEERKNNRFSLIKFYARRARRILPALLFRSHKPGCTEWIAETMEKLQNDKNIQNILLVFSYGFYFTQDENGRYPYIPNLKANILSPEVNRNLLSLDTRMIFWKSLETLVFKLLDAGKNIYIVYPVPKLPADIKKGVIPWTIFGTETLMDLEKTTTKADYFSSNKFILEKLDSLPYGSNLKAVKPADIYCSAEQCSAVKDNKALYFHNNHPNLYGARLIVNAMYI